MKAINLFSMFAIFFYLSLLGKKNSIFLFVKHSVAFSLVKSWLTLSSLPPLPSPAGAAGEGPADVATGHVRPEQGDPQRPGPGAAGRLQAHVAHGGAHHCVSDPAADARRRGAAVEGGSQPALQHKGKCIAAPVGCVF